MQRPAARVDFDPATGTLAFHDARPSLHRAFLLWWALAALGAIVASASAAILAFFTLNIRGAAYAIKKVGKGLIALIGGIGFGISTLVISLYRQARVAHRYLDPKPDLELSPAGLSDHWLGLGLIRWDQIERAELHMQRPLNHRGIAIRLKNMDGWLAALPSGNTRGVRWRLRLADRFGNLFRLSQTGGETLGLSFLDLLYALACHVPVKGLPPGYLPQHPVLQSLHPPAANLYQSPEMDIAGIDTTPVEIRSRHSRLVSFVAAAGCFGLAIVLAHAVFDSRVLDIVDYIAAVLIVLSAGLGIMSLLAAFRPQPVLLRADADGLVVHAYRYYPLIRWQDIFSIDVETDDTRTVFHVDLYDIARYDQMVMPWTRTWYRCRRWFGGSLRFSVVKPEGSIQISIECIRALHTRAVALQAGAAQAEAAE